jgi:hypothetical protein
VIPALKLKIKPPSSWIRISIEKLPLLSVPAVGMVIRSVGGGYSCPWITLKNAIIGKRMDFFTVSLDE